MGCVSLKGCTKSEPAGMTLKSMHVVLFILEDGLYLPVAMALGEQYMGLMHWDSQVLNEVCDTVMIQIEVKKNISLHDTLMFIGRSVAGISVESVSSESVDIVLPEWCLSRTGIFHVLFALFS